MVRLKNRDACRYISTPAGPCHGMAGDKCFCVYAMPAAPLGARHGMAAPKNHCHKVNIFIRNAENFLPIFLFRVPDLAIQTEKKRRQRSLPYDI